MRTQELIHLTQAIKQVCFAVVYGHVRVIVLCGLEWSMSRLESSGKFARKLANIGCLCRREMQSECASSGQEGCVRPRHSSSVQQRSYVVVSTHLAQRSV